MNDLISRQVAIDAILHNQEVYSNNFGDDPIDKYTIAIIGNDAQTIAQLPSAQPERYTGEWENVDGIYKLATCSKCKKITMFETWGNEIRVYDFCPNCGADMRGQKNDVKSA